MPPQILLGRRAEVLRLNLKVRPTVVIVPDHDNYVRAIARWSLAERFPVLIDDGSDRAREDIARFVRAFEPKNVLHWSQPGLAADDRLPADPADFRLAIETAARLAWGARSPEELDAVWAQTKFTPFGVVVASPADPAWTAALALAAGRGQPIVWLDTKAASISHFVPEAQAQALDRQLAAALDSLGRPWRALGDDIDALTLCLNHGANIQSDRGRFALTDFLGRTGENQRAVWVGLLPGDEARAAYRAMCALFLQPRSAWLFDGYEPNFAPPYALPPAANALHEAGLDVSTNTPPLGGLSHWRARARWGVAFDFIHVNSSGNSPWFDLTPGRAYASEIPILHRPAMVHFVHSFSAQFAADVNGVAGRWLENGAYCYLGSMDEPFLGAFLPAQAVVARLLSGAPFAAAVRQEDKPVWKLNVFGDPLATMGRPAPRHDEPLSLDGASDLEARMKAALREKNLARGVADLVLLGRDKDAANIARAAFADENRAATPAMARAAVLAAFRTGDKDLFLALFERLAPDQQRDPVLADCLWQALRADIASTEEARVLNLLRAAIRDTSMVEDAEALAPAIRRLYGAEVVRSMYGTLLARAKDANIKKALSEAGAKY